MLSYSGFFNIIFAQFSRNISSIAWLYTVWIVYIQSLCAVPMYSPFLSQSQLFEFETSPAFSIPDNFIGAHFSVIRSPRVLHSPKLLPDTTMPGIIPRETNYNINFILCWRSMHFCHRNPLTHHSHQS